jgi:DNA-directed RNA polymerase subunit RPC12/RpoP
VKDVPFTPAGTEESGTTVFTCALCGTRFTHGGQSCGQCPLHTGCDVISCPQCGHSFPRVSRAAGWIRRLLARVGFGSDRREEKRPW